MEFYRFAAGAILTADFISCEYMSEEECRDIVKIVFVSNFLNHHQLPLCMAFFHMEGIDFWFIATEPVPQERLSLGYGDMNSEYAFVLRTYLDSREKEQAFQKIKETDVLLMGMRTKDYISKKDMEKKLIFLYSERIFRDVQISLGFFLNILRAVKNHTLNRSRNIYVLCTGAYVASDFQKVMAYRGRMYRWGYFPEVPKRDSEEVFRQKMPECVRILWAGRFLALKQPQQAIETAKELRKRGHNFHLDMIGAGEMKDEMKEQVCREDLEKYVSICKPAPFYEMRQYMDRSHIFLFTSNREEGWGAVLNEAMASRCAVVANRQIGSVPFLIQDGQNGLIYDGTAKDLLDKTEYLIINREKQREFGEQAYHTITTYWNADVAASHLVQLSTDLLSGKRNKKDMKGPCSYIG